MCVGDKLHGMMTNCMALLMAYSFTVCISFKSSENQYIHITVIPIIFGILIR